MNLISQEQLQKHYNSALAKFSESRIYTDNKSGGIKDVLASVYAFTSAAAVLCSDFDKNIRSEFSALFKNEKSHESERVQVRAHKAGDLWGTAVTLENTLKFYEKYFTEAYTFNEILADTDALYRSAEEALLAFERFNSSDIKSEKISGLIGKLFSLVKSSDVSMLSHAATEYFIQLA